MTNKKYNNSNGAEIIDHFTFDLLNRLTNTITHRFESNSYWPVNSTNLNFTQDGSGNIHYKANAGSYGYSSAKPHAVTDVTAAAATDDDY